MISPPRATPACESCISISVTEAEVWEIEMKPLRIAAAAEAYRLDVVRLVERSLVGATHLVASRKGIFAVNRTEWSLLARGFFFGLTFRGQDVYAFEACDQPHSTSRYGRIVRFQRDGDRVTGACVVAKGLDNGCHQIDFLDDQLHVVDTYRQVLLRFNVGETAYETLTPLPNHAQGRWDRYEADYVHVNSILRVGDRKLLLLHNTPSHTGRSSQVAVFDESWKPITRWPLNGRGCHGLAMLQDGTLLTCDSMAGDLISLDGKVRVHVSPDMTRGLSVGAEALVVGASRMAMRDERLSSAGTVSFLDSDYRIHAVLDLPGAPTEIRRLDRQDSGLSSYLEQSLWGTALNEVQNP